MIFVASRAAKRLGVELPKVVPFGRR
jgi:hypothetical protein